MLAFLLDEHISPTVAAKLVARRPEMVVYSLSSWEAGAYLGAPDWDVLLAARAGLLTLVTYDQRTLVPLLRLLAEHGLKHTGVVLIDERTIHPARIGDLVRALEQLWERDRDLDWTGRVMYLTRHP
ncbi:MAG TPA: DUF5615 family PIN-like protein [Candidatus Obscuribacterales bacterium]